MGTVKRLRLHALLAVALLLLPARTAAQHELPELTSPVTDLAGVIDPENVASIDGMCRALERASGDAVVVVTVPSIEPFADIREMAVKMFENHGRGIGQKEKHNGLLVLLALRERRVWIEVGYGLEEFITDGYAGETTREYMVPAFRRGAYGEGLRDGVARIVTRISERRGVALDQEPRASEPQQRRAASLSPFIILAIFLLVLIISRASRPPGVSGRRGGRWGWPGGWSGWNSGVGPFGGGGFGGGFGGSGGSGGGGGFGGFGGGGSGGGGGGGSW